MRGGCDRFRGGEGGDGDWFDGRRRGGGGDADWSVSLCCLSGRREGTNWLVVVVIVAMVDWKQGSWSGG